jgi:hypothetical protein
MRNVLTRTFTILVGSLMVFSLLAIPPQVMAATQTAGSTPSEAAYLGEGQATGHLAPGEAAWYVYEPYVGDGATEQVGVVTLIFTPAVALGAGVSGVNFEIFSTGQVTSGKDITTVPPIGMGGYVSRDGDPNTAELLWQGDLPVPATYYVRVYNDTALDIDYWLFTDDVIYPELGDKPAVALAEDAPAGSTPAVALTMPPGETVKGHLGVEEELWYTFSPPDYGYDRGKSGHTFTLFFTPSYGLGADHVGFEIMTAEQLLLRLRGNTHLNTGSGAAVSRDGDPLTGERLWSGQLMDNHTYLVRVFNGSDIPVDFWLFQEDVTYPILGEAPPAVTAASVPAGTDFYHAVDLVEGLNRGSLEPGEARYYSFGWDTLPSAEGLPMYLTMFFTPDDGNRGSRVGFDLVTDGEVHLWARGDADEIHPFGAGSRVSRDGNPLTGESLWAGWIFSVGTYYVKVFNGSDSPIDYWLFTDDVVNVTLGSAPKVAGQVMVPPGADPNHALPLDPTLNRGILDPGQERWYSVEGDVMRGGLKQLTLSLFFVPDDGHRVRYVKLDLFGHEQLHIWARGEGELHPFGSGGVVSRDGDDNTGELLWKGWLFSGGTYYIRVYNGADVPITYVLLPEDVEHPQMGDLLGQ